MKTKEFFKRGFKVLFVVLFSGYSIVVIILSGLLSAILTVPYKVMFWKNESNIVTNHLLFLFSLFALIFLYPVGYVYKHLKSIFGLSNNISLSTYFRRLAVSHDQLGNVVMYEMFNDVLKKESETGVYFGDEDEVISSVIGKLKLRGSLSFAGKVLDFLLNLFDPGHGIKSIEADEGIDRAYRGNKG